MDKKTIYWILGLSVLTISLIFIARSGGTPDSFVDSFLEVEDKKWNFGTISMANGNVAHSFVVKNSGDKELEITKVQTSCMCTEANLKMSNGEVVGPFGMHSSLRKENIKVGPGETMNVEAIFDPNAHGPSGTGFVDRTIYIETNSTKKNKVELKFTANVIR